MKLSVIMPVRKEPLMQRTIDSLLAAAEIDLQMVVVLDGSDVRLPNPHQSVDVVQLDSPVGMRGAINAGLAVSVGDFVMKVDAHCAFAQGFAKRMVEDHVEPNWLLIPRRHSLDDESWEPNLGKPARDYHFFTYPEETRWGYATTSQPWRTKVPRDRRRRTLDDTMSFQGSCWMADRKFFMERVGLLDDRRKTYGPFAADQLEIGLKYWLTDGEIKVDKNTWYAHLCKMPRHYNSGEYERKSHGLWRRNWAWATDHWVNDKEPGMAHPFSWLVEKFWPVPTWPEDRGLWRYPG